MASHKAPRGPGKTAPRLISDLLDYDLRYRRKRGGGCLLTDPAPQYFEGGPTLWPRTGEHDCHHQLMVKQAYTLIPQSEDETLDASSKFIVATFCPSCRWYFDITVDYSAWLEGASIACHPTNHDAPLHHFRVVESLRAEDLPEEHRGSKYKPIAELHRFICSNIACPVKLEIKITPPRLKPEYLALILDTPRVQNRGKKEIESDPQRYSADKPLYPITVLSFLRQYLTDARTARGSTEGKKIAKRNKKYMLAFGPECESLFEYLEFIPFEFQNPEADEPEYFWKLPQVTQGNKEFFDDLDIEIQLKLVERPQGEKETTNRYPEFIPLSARQAIVRTLRYHDYAKSPRSRGPIDLSETEHPHYASLGAVPDFSDDLIIWSYKRQCECDPANKPYYLDCLSGMSKGRGSDEIETTVAMAISAGEYSQSAIEGAFKLFGLESNTKEGDDHIIGLYKSRIQSAPRQKNEAKTCLLIISKVRKSDKLAEIANDKAMTFEEAIEFLSVSADTSPDMISAQAVAVASDGDVTRTARALRVIANKLGNRELQQAATDMESGTAHMPIDEAYRRLQIQDRMASEEMIFAYYEHLTKDAPATRDHYGEALRAIAVEKASNYLLAKLDDPNAVVAPTPSTSDQPIGLDNIGNTCYLNSLLQYYYTVKAIRNLVMNFQDHRMPLSEEAIKKKRVGGRSVAKAEIIKAQKFVDELHNLFENLKTASTRSIKPTRDLAELTIFSSAAAANFRRASISSPQVSLDQSSMTDHPMFGPMPRPMTPPTRPSPMPHEEDVEMVDHPGDKSSEDMSESSEATLVEDEALPTYSQAVGDDSPRTIKGDDEQPLLSNRKDSEGDAVMLNMEVVLSEKTSSPPEKPPPVPPRNKTGLSIQTNENKASMIDDDLWRFGSQQDVTEVIGNVMFRLQCAIKPTSIDERSGEQIDVIRDTFYGSVVVYSQKSQTLERKVEAVANLNVFPAPSGPRDIYEALDVFFDQQLVDIDNTTVPQYSSIDKLPPILQIQIQRTAFDPVRKIASKNQNPVTFPETIYLDRYMDSEDPSSLLMRRRRETWAWKEKLRVLEARRDALKGQHADLPVSEALVAVRDLVVGVTEIGIEGVSIEPDLAQNLQDRTVEINEELEAIDVAIARLKNSLNEQFTDMNKYEYKLQTVFIHRGEAGGGHYWIYIYDFEKDVWRKYNDDRVDVVTNRKEIFEPQKVVDGTPYYLVYVRSEEREDLVEAVHRDVPAPQTETEAMQTDEAIDLDEQWADDVRHVEHVRPRPLRPKPVRNTVGGWETDIAATTDANGNMW